MVSEHEPCRYLGFWATANGDMKSMKKKVITRIKQAIEVVRGHPLLPDLALEIFKSMAIGVFCVRHTHPAWNFLRKSWKAQTKEAGEETAMSIPQCVQQLSRQCNQKRKYHCPTLGPRKKLLVGSALPHLRLVHPHTMEARSQEKGKREIKQAKPAAAGERKHQNTNAKAGHMIRTNTRRTVRSKTSQAASHSHEPESSTEDPC